MAERIDSRIQGVGIDPALVQNKVRLRGIKWDWDFLEPQEAIV